MFIAKAKLSNEDSVKVTAVGSNFMAALAEIAKKISAELKDEAAGITKLSISYEAEGTSLRRLKFRPRKEDASKPALTVAGKGR